MSILHPSTQSARAQVSVYAYRILSVTYLIINLERRNPHSFCKFINHMLSCCILPCGIQLFFKKRKT